MTKIIFRIALLLSICNFSARAQTAWTIYKTNNSALLDNGIKAVSIDNNNHKWVGCAYGLGEYNDTTWTMYTTLNSGLPDDNISSIKIDKNNVKWIGTNNGGLAKFDGTTWTVWNTINSGLPSDEIKCIAFDTLGNKWLGTANGLVKFDDTNFTVWNHNNTPYFLIVIHAIAIDKNNVKYISSLNSGLFYMTDTNFIHYNVSNSYLQDNFVFSIALDSSQNRWYGTAGKGIMSQHTDSITWEWYYPGNTPADSAWTVNCILIDSMQHKYMGSHLTGLVKYDGTNWTYWETYNSPMPSNRVNTIAQEKQGIFWIGTDNGLARFDESVPTNIAENIFSSQINIYPNPAKDKINIILQTTNAENLSLEILDIYGVLHLKTSLHSGNNYLALPENNFGSGIYFYRLNQNGRVGRTSKLVVSNE